MNSRKFFLTLAIPAMLVCCKPRETEEGKEIREREVFIDTEYDSAFFPQGNSFTGGDGTYSVQLPDGRNVWIFGDSFIGGVTPDLKRIETNPPSLVRNCFVILDHDSLITLHQGKRSELKSMMIPPEVSIPGSRYAEHDYWYWPGDGFVENGALKVFVSKFFQEDHADMWAFKFLGTELVEFSLPDLAVQKISRFEQTDSVHYGHAILEAEQHTYIYGLKKGKPYVARAVKGNVQKPWEYYTGTSWASVPDSARSILEFPGSEQFSVFQWKQQYIMIMQEGNLSQNICSFTAMQPEGPWGNKKVLYKTPLPDSCSTCWTYNALAHPELTKDSLILISYNTNTMDFKDHFAHAAIYRPRFIRVPVEKILKN